MPLSAMIAKTNSSTLPVLKLKLTSPKPACSTAARTASRPMYTCTQSHVIIDVLPAAARRLRIEYAALANAKTVASTPIARPTAV